MNQATMCKAIETVSILLLLFILVATPKAHAYVDPSTGSYVIEVAAAAFFTFMYFAKNFFKVMRYRIVAVIPKKRLSVAK